ncbi:hypothetical protein OV079_02620 [Nannocystis pusilla]|uniref:Uncharacterized protein n=1 Tax=Nannocystis pusilla TaxID=889268 RepID=A0A9X3IV30_9BACT|nr:hypothetical protein [Nannocystis pusilla]MCY1004480.1 hypothetical protein [Nannocystis pusilla]
MFLSDKIPQQSFCTHAFDAWFRSGAQLSELYKVLLRDNPHAQDKIDALFRPALAEQAFREDGIQLSMDVYDVPDLLELVKQYAVRGKALARWLEYHAPGVTTQTPALPPVLFLVLCGERLTSASLRVLGMRTRHLSLPASSPGAPPGITIRSGDDLVRAVRRLIHELRLTSSNELVLVIQADPVAVALRPQAARVPGTEDTLEEWLAAVAWWPQIDGVPVEGCLHDGALPAPSAGGQVALWERVPTNRQERRSASLGIWASQECWTANCECAVLGTHNRRYFAVLADADLRGLIQDTHPDDGPTSLKHLFDKIRGRARLVWTDRRYFLYTGDSLE